MIRTTIAGVVIAAIGLAAGPGYASAGATVAQHQVVTAAAHSPAHVAITCKRDVSVGKPGNSTDTIELLAPACTPIRASAYCIEIFSSSHWVHGNWETQEGSFSKDDCGTFVQCFEPYGYAYQNPDGTLTFVSAGDDC
jgi:hypothetical protein